jgi:hypothetical protein
LPALVFLLGLSLLTALVWWRVIHRADAQSSPNSAPTSCAAKPTVTVLPQPKAVSVQVLNSTTTRNGLAATTKTSLTKLGFVVVGVGNDSTGTIPGVAEIRYGPANAAGASLLSYYLPGATLVNTGAAGTQVTVSLGLKFVAPATAAAAKAAMVAAHVSQSPVTAGGPTTPHPTPGRPSTTAKSSSTGARTTPSC